MAPGADPSQLGLSFEGGQSLRLDESGDRVVASDWGTLRQRRPVIYQEVDGQRVVVPGGYTLEGTHLVAFRIGS